VKAKGDRIGIRAQRPKKKKTKKKKKKEKKKKQKKKTYQGLTALSAPERGCKSSKPGNKSCERNECGNENGAVRKTYYRGTP